MCAVVVDDDDLRLLGLQRLRSRLRVALLSRTLYVRSLVVYYNDLRLHGLRDRLRCGSGLGLRETLSAVTAAAALHVRPLVVYHNDLRLLLLHLLRLLRLRTRLLHLLRYLLLHRHLPLLLRLRLIPLLLLPVTLLRLPVIRLPARLLRVVGLRRSRLLPVCGLLLKLSAVALLLSSELRLRLLRKSVLLSHARLRGIRLRIVILLRRLLRAEIRL